MLQLSAAEGSLLASAVLGRYRRQSSKRTTVQNKKDPILGKLYATPRKWTICPVGRHDYRCHGCGGCRWIPGTAKADAEELHANPTAATFVDAKNPHEKSQKT